MAVPGDVGLEDDLAGGFRVEGEFLEQCLGRLDRSSLAGGVGHFAAAEDLRLPAIGLGMAGVIQEGDLLDDLLAGRKEVGLVCERLASPGDPGEGLLVVVHERLGALAALDAGALPRVEGLAGEGAMIAAALARMKWRGIFLHQEKALRRLGGGRYRQSR